MKPLQSIDLFTGCGGLTLGLGRAGFSPLFAIEKDPMAFETLSENMLGENAAHKSFSEWPAWLEVKPWKIENVLSNRELLRNLSRLKGKVDLISGGPPCQGFSVGGIRNGDDERNQLPKYFMEFVTVVEPPFVLFENVEGMARRFRSKPGKETASFLSWLISRFDGVGYWASPKIVNASRFGVPQVRRRLIVIAVRKSEIASEERVSRFFEILDETADDFVRAKGLQSEDPPTVRQALDDLCSSKRMPCPDSPRFMTSPYNKPQSRFACRMRHGNVSSVPDSHRFSRHSEKTLAFYQLVQETQPYGRLSKKFLLSCGTKKDKKVFLDPEAPASTITTHPDEFIHYKEPRIITVREMARLQSFPDSFRFRGRYTINGPRRRFDVARCSQVGNAVPPLLAEALGRALQEFIAHETRQAKQLWLPYPQVGAPVELAEA